MKNQGKNASPLFKGMSQSREATLFYGESVDLFAQIVKKNFVPGTYTLADLGGNKGEFLSKVTEKLPEYSFKSYVVDVNLGIEIGLNAEKIDGNILENKFEDKSIDIVFLRYALSWNPFDKQKDVLKEVSRICKGVTIIQHQGYNDVQISEQDKVFSKIFDGRIPEIARNDYFPTNLSQVEKWMSELGLRFSRVQNRKVENISNLFIEKYRLNEKDAQLIKDILSGCDYLMQTCWVLDFRN